MARAPLLYDVAIVGAGPAGSATAIHLARRGWRVALVDRATFPRDKPCAEYLSPAAGPLLADLGVLAALEVTRPGRLRGFRVFAPSGRMFQGDFAATRDASGRSLFETGMAIPRALLDATLVDAARTATADVREGWALAQIARDEATGHHILLPRPGHAAEPIRARLLIAADGVHSTVARRLGLHRPGHLRKVALVSHMRGIADLCAYGEMHIAPGRYVGLAPLEPPTAGDLCNVALVVEEAPARHALAGRTGDYLLETLHAFPELRNRLAHATIARRTLATSGLCTRARRLSADGVLLVGDAAGYYDPFTGEGIYRALVSARLAAGAAATALSHGEVSAAMLARYDRLHRDTFRGKHAVEALVQMAVRTPAMMEHVARVLHRRKALADTLVAVTGDFLPPAAVLRPGFLIRLLA